MPGIRRTLDSKTVLLAELRSDGELRLNRILGGYQIISQVPSNTPDYHAWLEVLGPLNPGEFKDLTEKVVRAATDEALCTVEMLERFIFTFNSCESIEIASDGTLIVWDKVRIEGSRTCMKFAKDGEHKRFLESHYGRLTPGRVIADPQGESLRQYEG